VPVEVSVNVDPTNDNVFMAFFPLPGGFEVIPEVGDWENAEWDPDVSTSPYVARCLVGPDGIALTEGEYAIWLMVEDSPEIPVRPVDRLIVFGEAIP
jgi:hypothetical protein